MQNKSKIRVNKMLAENAHSEEARKQYQEKVDEAVKEIKAENTQRFTKELLLAIPFLVAKENREHIYEIIAIIAQETIEEVKAQPASKLFTRLKQLIADMDFKSFLSFQEQSDSTE